MEHHLQRWMAVEEAVQIVRADHPGGRVLGEVAPFAIGPEGVDDDGFVPAAQQRRLQVGADESGAASYQDHGCAIYGSRPRPAKPFARTGAHEPWPIGRDFSMTLPAWPAVRSPPWRDCGRKPNRCSRARVDDILQRMDLVRREEFEAVQELAANARNGQEAAEVHGCGAGSPACGAGGPGRGAGEPDTDRRSQGF